MKTISAVQFSFFRMCLGTYLFIHFFSLIPFGEDLFSSNGMLPHPGMNPTSVVFPINILSWFDSPGTVNLFLAALCLSSLVLICGWKRRWFSAFILYGWVCLFNRNNLTITPDLAFIGFLLANMIFIKEGEPMFPTSKQKTFWEVPRIVWAGAWFIMSLSYTLSGIDKLSSVSWVNGNAVKFLLENPLIRETSLVSNLKTQSPLLLQAISYTILIAELLFLPLAYFKVTRAFIWTLMVLIHLSILLMMNMAELTTGMLLVHLFTLDPSWIPFQKTLRLKSKIIPQADV